MNIIGISGKKGSGKDTFAKLLQKSSNKKIYLIAFADSLKAEVYTYILKPHGLPMECLYDERKDNFRLILQGWGTDFKRNLIDKDYWVNRVKEKIAYISKTEPDATIILTDIRLQNEADLVREYNGVLLRIERPELSSEDNHQSETELDGYKFDYYIENQGSIEDFESKAKFFINSILK